MSSRRVQGHQEEARCKWRRGYRASRRDLQIELVEVQKHIINMIRDLIARLARAKTNKHMATPDREIVFPYEKAHADAGLLAA